jgi:sterol desaturase/sphingolipid hydroxylase (fatty acid hydroxylase superfamily)
MHFEKIKNKGQAKLFDHPALESLTKTHPAVIYAMYFPVIAIMLYYGAAYKGLPVLGLAGVFALGAISWSLFEYVMHRWVFHMAAETPRAKKVVYTMHGVHHEYPRDKERLFLPPIPSIIAAVVLSNLFYFLMGNYMLAFFPGFLFGYMAYGSMHYAIHAYAPPRWLKALWRNHHLHHYKAPDKGFGVSSVVWDIVFGTVPKKEEIQAQQTNG